MPTKSTISYFYFSIGFTIFATIAGFALGYATGGLGTAITFAFLTLVLGVMETSLSFDNAVVNATVLENWDEKWRQRFIVWGIPIAVFGMRLVFPLAIVALIAGLGPIAVISMAVNNPAEYARILTSSHHQVAGFGGAFLLMLGIQYFTQEKQTYWWEAVESRFAKLGDLHMIEAGITALIVLVIGSFLGTHGAEFIFAGIAGLVMFIFAKGLGDLLGGGEDSGGGKKIVKAGAAGFLYLELLDASFSFDGVIGAFAITNNIFIITLGLAIGAFFVRSLTIFLVDKGTLTEYRYLEHGAFWAILVLAGIMFTSVFIQVPEIITGLLGASLIGLSLWHSIQANKTEQSQPKEQIAS